MIPRYSVKRPYTVVVAVVLVLILGFVSFTSMKTDLLPDMNLPYAIVYTTYPGASPEEVETVVTRPVEQAMATISNVEQVTSVSGENISTVILEFAQSANMDSVTLEMRESLDQMTGYWDGSVGSPIIMKLNPDMMPVMVAAIEAGDMDSTQLTDFVNNEILPELESIEGVASVSASGAVEEEVQVVLRQDKIDEVNRKVSASLDQKFSEGEQKLADSREELENGKTELENGQKELAAQTAQAENQINSGQGELIKNEIQMEEKLSEVQTKLTELETSKTELEAKKKELESAESQLKELPKQLKSLQEQKEKLEEGLKLLDAAPDQLTQLDQGIQAAQAAVTQLEALSGAQAGAQAGNPSQGLLGSVPPAGMEGSQTEGDLNTQLETAKAQLQKLQDTKEQAYKSLKEAGVDTSGDTAAVIKSIESTKTELTVRKVQLEDGIKQLEETSKDSDQKQKEITAGKKQISQGMTQIEEGKAQLTQAKAQIEGAKAQLDAGKITLEQALETLNAQKINATIEMAAAKAKLDLGEQELDAAAEELKTQKDTAYEQADVNEIITAQMVQGILTAQNFTMPAGYVTEEGIDYLVRVGDELENTQDLENLVLLDLHMDGVEPIRLSDVADVVRTDNSKEVYARINGHAGLLFTMQKQSGYSTGEVSDAIKERFESLSAQKEEVHFTELMDQGIYIDMVVDSVLENIMFGGLLAVLVLLLFLKSVRPTIVIAFSMPISILAALVLMYFSGINLNIISLSGLALGIGMLVDNSIVVIENIYRLRGEGMPVKKAAVEGARQVAGAIAASTLTTICVFAPIVFTEGITRQLFVDMGLTIAYSLLASLGVALTLVPMMGAGLLKNVSAKKMPLLEKVQNAYAGLLAKALNHRALVLGAAVALLALSAALAVSRGTAFMPEMESTQISVSIETAKDSTLEETGKIADEAADRILEIPDVTDVGAMSGSSSGISLLGNSGKNNQVSMYVLLKEKKELTNEEMEKEILERTKGLDCTVDVETSSMDMSALGGSGLSIKVKGRELDTLHKMAKDVAEILESVEGTEEVSDGLEETTQELRIRVKKKKAMEYQLTTAQIFQFLQEKLADPSSATTLSTQTKDLSVYVLKETDSQLTREEIKKLTIEGQDAEGETVNVPLSKLVKFEDQEGLSSINREAQTRYVTVSAQVDRDHNIGLLSREVEKKLQDYEIPEGYQIEIAGENETINDAMTEVLKMLALALVFMYLIMVAQFQSLLSPFIIMFTIPLAFTGGLMGLYLTGNPISVIAMIGFVMLSGIIVNNGIVLVDYTNQLRREGMDKREALVEAGRTRLRPIVMTALTTVLGLSTMAAGMGMGADMVQPMAIVTIGRLLYGTLLTLLVVPCIYDILNRKKDMTEEEI